MLIHWPVSILNDNLEYIDFRVIQVTAIQSGHLGTCGLGFIFAAVPAEYRNAEDGCVPEKKMESQAVP